MCRRFWPLQPLLPDKPLQTRPFPELFEPSPPDLRRPDFDLIWSELFAMGPVQFSRPVGVAESSFTKPTFCRFFPGKTAKHRVH